MPVPGKVHLVLKVQTGDAEKSLNRVKVKIKKLNMEKIREQRAAREEERTNSRRIVINERLKRTYDKTYAATVKFNRHMRRLDGNLKRGNITAETHAQLVDQLKTQYERLTPAAARMGREMNQNAFFVGNLASQFNDIGVMLAAGQSPLMLALQQGTQVNQVLDVMRSRGEALGTLKAAFASFISPLNLLTIGVIAAGAALGQLAIKMFSAKEETDETATALDNLREATRDYRSELELLNSIAGSREELEVMQQLETVRRRQARAQAALNKLQKEFTGRAGQQAKIDQAKSFLKELGFQEAALEQQLEEHRDIKTEVEATKQAEEDLTAQINATTSALDESRKAAEDRQAAIANRRQLASFGRTETSRIVSGYEAQAKAAEEARLAREEAARQEALARQRDRLPEQLSRAETARLMGLAPDEPVDRSETPSGRRGRRIPQERTQEDIDRLRDSFKSERELLVEEYEKQRQLVLDYYSTQVSDAEQKNRLLEQLQARHQERMRNLDRQEHMRKVGMAGDLFGTLSQLMQSENEKMFKIGKAASIANAIVNAYEGISATLAKYPFPFSVAMAAAQAAVAFAQIQKIKSTQFNSTSGSPSVSASSAGAGQAGAVAAQAAQAPQNRSVEINFSSGELLPRSAVIGLIGQINEAVGDGVSIRVGG